MSAGMMEPSIFYGVDQEIDRILWLPKEKGGAPPLFRHKAASDHLSANGRMRVGTELVKQIYNQVEGNWKRCDPKPKAAEELWVPRRRPEWSEDWKSVEVPLERSVVALFKFHDVLHKHIDNDAYPHLTWFNQIPTASGLVSPKEGRNAIDLVCRTKPGGYDFVELKFPKRGSSSETPLNAAMEILKNGVLYLFTRRHLPELEREQGYHPQLAEDIRELKGDVKAREILEASEIALCVLGPNYFYQGYDLAWLEDELNEGLAGFLAKYPVNGVAMTFRFESLSDEPFEITKGNGFRLDFDRRHPVCWGRASDNRS